VSLAVPPEVLALAEDVNTYLPVGRGRERIVDGRYVIWLSDGPGPAYTVVQRLRLTPESVEAVVQEVRALLRARGRPASTWEIGTSATPAGLEARLSALGMQPFADPDVAGMVLDGHPGPAPGIAVRRAESLADYVAAERINQMAFGDGPADASVEQRAERKLGGDRESGVAASFLAVVDGRPVGTARVVLCDAGAVFSSGCVLPGARGRGAYRALVAARVDHARAAGASVVVTQAGRMSRPILERLGFREVVRVRVLVDEQAAAGTDSSGAVPD
jgi:GNAT superfamily N-acetyltransferase